MPVFERSADHEQVVFCSDPPSGLRAIIAIYSTALGPALGGTRFHPYPSEDAALDDVLALSKAMAYKAACAGLDLGGGKAVVLGDPSADKSEALLRAYGRFVQSLGGRYRTACDVGTTVEDMDVVARECRYVTGRSEAHGGSGDSGVLTAYGVYRGMQACAEHVWGRPSLAGRRVAVAGVGKVGRALVGDLLAEGARVVVSDVSDAAVARLRETYPQVEAVAPEKLAGQEADIFAPCALGGALDDATVEALTARIVCGGANNQLPRPGTEARLAARGILYAPDFVVNAGGLIQVADEIDGYDAARARARTDGIFETTRTILAKAAQTGLTAAAAADRMAEQRMGDIGRLRGILVPPRRRGGGTG